MFDDFTTQIQSDELAEIIGWNDAMEDPRYLYEEEWFGALVKRPKTPPFHGGNTGSNPVGVTTRVALVSKLGCENNYRQAR